MGRPKQTLCYQGQSLVLRAALAAHSATGAEPVVVVGANAELVDAELAEAPVRTVVNADWSLGIGSSIRCGLAALLRAAPEVTGVLLVLCDQPLVTEEHLKSIVCSHLADQGRVIASGYSGTMGVPVLFPRTLFGALQELADTSGAQGIITRHTDCLVVVDCAAAAVDVDTEADYAALA